MKRVRGDTESSTISIGHERSVESDNYKTYNDPTESGRLYRMAEGKLGYFGEAALTTYENIPEGVTGGTPLLKLEQTISMRQSLILCLRLHHVSNMEKYNKRFRIGLRRLTEAVVCVGLRLYMRMDRFCSLLLCLHEWRTRRVGVIGMYHRE